MGATPHARGVAFRVWAPNAQHASIIGSFNDWDGAKHPMQAEANGYWYANVAEAHVGDPYRFLLTAERRVQAHRPLWQRGEVGWARKT